MIQKQTKAIILLSKFKDQLITTKFQFFEEIVAKISIFLKRFQTDAPMVSFLADTLDELIRYMCSEFILNDVLEKAQNNNFIDIDKT